MDRVLLPGELVVKRIRWSVDAQHVGIILGTCGKEEWLVMWTTDDNHIRFDVHITDALLTVDDTSLKEIMDRSCVSV